MFIWQGAAIGATENYAPWHGLFAAIFVVMLRLLLLLIVLVALLPHLRIWAHLAPLSHVDLDACETLARLRAPPARQLVAVWGPSARHSSAHMV